MIQASGAITGAPYSGAMLCLESCKPSVRTLGVRAELPPECRRSPQSSGVPGVFHGWQGLLHPGPPVHHLPGPGCGGWRRPYPSCECLLELPHPLLRHPAPRGSITLRMQGATLEVHLTSVLWVNFMAISSLWTSMHKPCKATSCNSQRSMRR